MLVEQVDLVDLVVGLLLKDLLFPVVAQLHLKLLALLIEQPFVFALHQA